MITVGGEISRIIRVNIKPDIIELVRKSVRNEIINNIYTSNSYPISIIVGQSIHADIQNKHQHEIQH